MTNINHDSLGLRPREGVPTAAPRWFPFDHDSLFLVDHDERRREEIQRDRAKQRAKNQALWATKKGRLQSGTE